MGTTELERLRDQVAIVGVDAFKLALVARVFRPEAASMRAPAGARSAPGQNGRC